MNDEMKGEQPDAQPVVRDSRTTEAVEVVNEMRRDLARRLSKAEFHESPDFVTEELAKQVNALKVLLSSVRPACGVQVLIASARQAWTEINSVEDLPKEAGQYLWRFRKTRGDSEFKAEYFLGGVPATYYLDWFSHWQKISTPQTGGEG